MSNQDLTELQDINSQIEKLQNQKRIIQQKLQDQNDMMMVENHLFSQPEIQELIQKIEKDLPEFKINIDYTKDEIIFSHNNHDFYKTGMPYLHLNKNKKELITNLKFQLKLKEIYEILIELNYSIKHLLYQPNGDQTIIAYDKINKIYAQLYLKYETFIKENEIAIVESYREESQLTYNLFKLDKYDIEIEITADDHYDYHRDRDVDDSFSMKISQKANGITIKGLKTTLKHNKQIIENTKDIWYEKNY